jgi:hypothetical protein
MVPGVELVGISFFRALLCMNYDLGMNDLKVTQGCKDLMEIVEFKREKGFENGRPALVPI